MSETKNDEQSADKRERNQMQATRRHWRRVYKVIRQSAWMEPDLVFFTDPATGQVTYV